MHRNPTAAPPDTAPLSLTRSFVSIICWRKGIVMSSTDLALQDSVAKRTGGRVVNDFSIQIATVNGSGSQTANLVLLRSIFQMGVPVSGENMFPSNIAGLPT